MISSVIIVLWHLLLAILIVLAKAQTVDRNRRIDCYPDPGANQQNCRSRGCIWDTNFNASHPTVPLCYFPSDTGYELIGSPDANPAVISKKSTSASNPFGVDVQTLNVQRSTIGKTLNVKIAPTIGDRYLTVMWLGVKTLLITADMNQPSICHAIRRCRLTVFSWP